jgi:hypothetical protein
MTEKFTTSTAVQFVLFTSYYNYPHKAAPLHKFIVAQLFQ